tara:strand:+ start:412 stop:732 length:321 start_codon:yes stop_codon:yes gene_type:complete
MTNKNPLNTLRYFFGPNSPFKRILKKRTIPKPRIQYYTLRGDRLSLEQIEIKGRSSIKLCFPQNQVAQVSHGTRAQSIRYHSPTDRAQRIVDITYLNGRCRIEIPK